MNSDTKYRIGGSLFWGFFLVVMILNGFTLWSILLPLVIIIGVVVGLAILYQLFASGGIVYVVIITAVVVVSMFFNSLLG